MIGKSTVSKWVYDFDCHVCENIQYVFDPEKKRDGFYCIPTIEAVDRRPADWAPFNPDGSLRMDDTDTIHADARDRHVRCNHFKSCQLSLF